MVSGGWRVTAGGHSGLITETAGGRRPASAVETGGATPTLDEALAEERAARKRAQSRAWYAAHREAKLAYQRNYYASRRTEINARRRAARAARRAARLHAAAQALPLARAAVAAARVRGLGIAGGRPSGTAGSVPHPSPLPEGEAAGEVQHPFLWPHAPGSAAAVRDLLPEDIERASAIALPSPAGELVLGLRVAGVRLQWRYRPDTQTWTSGPSADDLADVAAALAARRSQALSSHAVDSALYPALLALVRLAEHGTASSMQGEAVDTARDAALQALGLLDGDWPDEEAEQLAAEARTAVARLCAYLGLA